MAVDSETRKNARAIYRILTKTYPEVRCELDFKNPLQLLVAVVLSAQCTDVAVNRATPALFRTFPRVKDYALATPLAIEPLIRSIGLFRSKARALFESAQLLEMRFAGEVPQTMHELVQLRGVARKTANVVLGNCFGLNEGVVVDTHVERLAHRFGLSRATTPQRIELDLMALFPRANWCVLSHLLILHGRRVCKARGGLCESDEICSRFCSENGKPRTTKKVAQKTSESR